MVFPRLGLRDRLRGVVCTALVMVCALFVHGAALADDTPNLSGRRVLLLYSYHPTFPTVPKVLQGLTDGFGAHPPEIEIEYMDSKRIHTPASVALFKKNLAFKLKSREPYNVVVTADDNALNFMLDEGQELLPGVPIVFLGVNNLQLAASLEEHPKVTGVVEAASLKETIELAHTLFPDMGTLHIISDGTTSGSSDLASTLALQPYFPNLPFSVINLAELGWADFMHGVRGVPKTDAVLLLSAYRDKYQEGLSFENSLKLIMTASSAPVFHPYEHGLGDGVLGGMVISHREQGRQAALKVTQILTGKPVDSLPILSKSPNVPEVDKRQLDRFEISMDRVPKGVKLLYYTPSTWQQYWKEITIVAVIIGLMAVIIVILAHQNRVRAKFAKTLAESEKRLRTILDNIEAYIYMKNADGQYLFANQLMCTLFNRPAAEVVSKSDGELFANEDAEKRDAIDKDVMQTQKLFRQEESIWNSASKAQRDLNTTKIPLINDQGETYALCGVSLDVTAHKEYERQLEQIAHYDQLTGLPNRVLFSDRLVQAMKRADRQDSVISVLYMDLDGFKDVNDAYGHPFGDELLKEVTLRIKNSIRGNDTVARFGGDEFIVLLVDSGTPEDDLDITQRILTAVSAPMLVKRIPVTISASIGIARYPQAEPMEADHLLRQADQAMYMAKNMGRNRYHFFDPEVEVAALEQEKLITEVKRGLKEEQFRLFYQPKVSLMTGEVIGFEALIRWQHPEKGLLPPGAFLPGIEKHSVMIEIDDWVMRQALAQLQEWQGQGNSFVVSINLSHMYFNQQNLAQILTHELVNYPDVPASLLGLEILETQALNNLTEVATVIRDCQKLGVRFALDDFGTGFSSLTYLKQLPINLLKVDRSFVINMLEDEEDRSILEGIMALCQAFNISAIAEGVETLEHGAELKRMGYQLAQGYGIAKPMPADAVLPWIAQWTCPDVWCD